MKGGQRRVVLKKGSGRVQLRTGGRSGGRISVRHRGGGARRRWRGGVQSQWVWRRANREVAGRVAGSSQQLVRRGDGLGWWQRDGDRWESWWLKGKSVTRLDRVPKWAVVSEIELRPDGGPQLARSLGSYARVVGRTADGAVILQLPSGRRRNLSGACQCTRGPVWGVSRWITSGKKQLRGDQQQLPKGKAGRTRHRGRRPTVRGVARNPVDHPHGGGEGKASGGRPAVTPWSRVEGERRGGRRRKQPSTVSRWGYGI